MTSSKLISCSKGWSVGFAACTSLAKHPAAGIRKGLIEYLQPFGIHFAAAARAEEIALQYAATLPSRSACRDDVIA